jgi:CubicO group peptidase (beta-lactamase class C family)
MYSDIEITMKLEKGMGSLITDLTDLKVRSCLITYQSTLLLEHYREPQLKQEIAKINSCTKSIVSALVCIAMDKGLLPPPETPIASFFPQFHYDPDPQKSEITIEHLLTMSAGFRWQEFKGINSFPNMIKTSNWLDYTLSQPLAHVPGTYMEYNSGCSQLLSSLIAQAAGCTTAEFAEQYLFGPLGITQYEWEYDPQGIHTGGFGLKLKPEDMLKFGQLFLNLGVWNDEQLISTNMVKRATAPFIETNAPRRGQYGWHWWMDSYVPQVDKGENQSNSMTLEYYYALGFGGQNIIVIPSLNLVVIITRDQTKRGKPPVDIFRQYIAPKISI